MPSGTALSQEEKLCPGKSWVKQKNSVRDSGESSRRTLSRTAVSQAAQRGLSRPPEAWSRPVVEDAPIGPGLGHNFRKHEPGIGWQLHPHCCCWLAVGGGCCGTGGCFGGFSGPILIIEWEPQSCWVDLLEDFLYCIQQADLCTAICTVRGKLS